MGQKVNPLGIRLGITRDWTSKWYAGKKQFPQHVYTDFRVRGFLRSRLSEASVSRIHIERAAKKRAPGGQHIQARERSPMHDVSRAHALGFACDGRRNHTF